MTKTLGELASEYAQKEFPVYPEKNDIRNIGKHDVAFHSFAAGWNAAKKESPWIKVEDDLPYKHKELLGKDGDDTKEVFVVVLNLKNNKILPTITAMADFGKRGHYHKWEWLFKGEDFKITHWMPIPQLPKE